MARGFELTFETHKELSFFFGEMFWTHRSLEIWAAELPTSSMGKSRNGVSDRQSVSQRVEEVQVLLSARAHDELEQGMKRPNYFPKSSSDSELSIVRLYERYRANHAKASTAEVRHAIASTIIQVTHYTLGRLVLLIDGNLQPSPLKRAIRAAVGFNVYLSSVFTSIYTETSPYVDIEHYAATWAKPDEVNNFDEWVKGKEDNKKTARKSAKPSNRVKVRDHRINAIH